MSELRALLWDVDGTLADTERDGHRPAFNAAFAEAGLDWQWSVERYGALLRVTGGKERIRAYLAEDHPDWLERDDLDDLIRGLHAAKTRHYVALLEAGGIPLRPGVAALLREAWDSGVRLAVVTTTTPANVDALLKASVAPALGAVAFEMFEVIAAGDIVAAKKPAPDIYHYALSALNLDARETLALEDSENGLRAALAADVATVVTINPYTAAQDFSGAVAVLNGLGCGEAPAHHLAGLPPVELPEGRVGLGALRAWHAAAQSKMA
ncbi:MAG: HAD-IA family hydrolase [Thioalkalivibrionaceae bacterium]